MPLITYIVKIKGVVTLILINRACGFCKKYNITSLLGFENYTYAYSLNQLIKQ